MRRSSGKSGRKSKEFFNCDQEFFNCDHCDKLRPVPYGEKRNWFANKEEHKPKYCSACWRTIQKAEEAVDAQRKQEKEFKIEFPLPPPIVSRDGGYWKTNPTLADYLSPGLSTPTCWTKEANDPTEVGSGSESPTHSFGGTNAILAFLKGEREKQQKEIDALKEEHENDCKILMYHRERETLEYRKEISGLKEQVSKLESEKLECMICRDRCEALYTFKCGHWVCKNECFEDLCRRYGDDNSFNCPMCRSMVLRKEMRKVIL